MTMETFERAVDIKNKMEIISELQNVLSNSNCDDESYLAAIKVKKFSNTGNVVEDCKVWNHIKIPKDIKARFEEVLWEEQHKLSKEFDEL